MAVSNGASRVAAVVRKKKVARGVIKQRAVTPESIFVVASGDNEDHIARAELMDKIQECHERDFHHLEDAMITRENVIHYQEAWETAASDRFDEQASMKALKWNQEMFDAAKESLLSTLDELLPKPGGVDFSWSATNRMRAVSMRCFFNGMSLVPEGSSSPMFRASNAQVTTVSAASAAARRYVMDSHLELEGLLDDEELELSDAIDVIMKSLAEEQEVRKRKINALQERAKILGTNTPRRIRVAGLRNEAAEANGIYVADGLRAAFERPIYVQYAVREQHHIFRLFYDMRHVKDEDYLDSSVKQKWVDGQWVLGPTMNADRCTAFIREGQDTTSDGKVDSHHEMMYPVSTAEMESVVQHWETYDIVTKTWREAPGEHCPGFDVRIEGTETMQEYIDQAVAQQQRMLEMLSAQTNDAEFLSNVTSQLQRYCHRGRIKRRNYMVWMAKFHADELIRLQNDLIGAILQSNDKNQLQLPPENDSADNRLLVSTIVQDFVYACDQKAKHRTMERKRFIDRINRPSLTKAFYSWKLVSRSKKRNQNVTSQMFVEPALPWNVRHPRSKWTSLWEGCQAVLLVYIAFSVPYRMAFNVILSDFEAYLELCVDIYFVIDVVRVLHLCLPPQTS